MTASRRSRVVALLAALAMAAPASGAVAQAEASLRGRWNLTLWVDSTAGATRTVSGTIVLVEEQGADRPTLRGSYRVPFSTIGLGPDAAPALLVQHRDESVRITLNPSAAARAELTGTWSTGMITGRWQWIGGPAQGGRFELRSGR